ncbi:class I adenylate-forming enzyme family protein [Candidimonas nitroreducens]|uniref:AMP-dependent synthetase n=1 Tax=Candidimonas nitroreducens TaxID=683354 RepID=A0A225N5S3_9BURK|nr:class I adenylate-forming enzyme family protein [Candidimonas nitroreducens]OWT66359.1 AMP-dependent synthetase [Candidimonas nitroreducens]
MTQAHRSIWGREIEQTKVRGNPCRVYRNRPHCVAQLLADAAQRWGTREFVVEGRRRLSFTAFSNAVDRTAGVLHSRGVGPESRVVLLAYNSIEWLAAFWAIQKLGGVAVLANAWWSAEEVRAALTEIEPALVVADQPGKRGLAPADAVLDIGMLRVAADTATQPEPLSTQEVDEDSLSVIMFSSGTTGRAKGVLMSHRGLIANIQNLLVLTGRLPDELPADATGTVSLLTVPLFHLAGVQVSISTLLSGGKLVLLEGRFEAEAVLKLVERERVRVWGSIPTMVSRVLDHPQLERFDVSTLRSIPMGGAAISPTLRERVQRAFPGVKKSVGSLYGCTEAGGVVAAGSATDLQNRPGCVGRPLPVVEMKIANPNADGIGEIKVRTPTATLGCWADPTPVADAAGWIGTGDLGWLQDGFLYLSGRSKDIVIRAGENVACAHVEQCLARHPAVREVAVIPMPHADLGEEVAAVVALRPGCSADIEELTAYALNRLGKFQVPSRWWLRSEALPTNASGKIAKSELRANWAGD